MQSLIRNKSAGVTGGRGTAGAGPGRDLLYNLRSNLFFFCFFLVRDGLAFLTFRGLARLEELPNPLLCG